MQTGQIKRNIKKINDSLPAHVKLVAVSKTKPNDLIMEAYNAGHKKFGENRVQDLIRKQPELPQDIEWHFIGHLQTNKVKYIAKFITLIESIDSYKLLKEVNKQGVKNNRVIDCLLQFHIATEYTKFGFSLQEAEEMLSDHDFNNLKNIKIIGVMGMATFTDDHEQIKSEFKLLNSYYHSLKDMFFINEKEFKEISMGMSGDYEIAIEEGSTMVRIGSSIFGAR